eukprot:g33774.t1
MRQTGPFRARQLGEAPRLDADVAQLSKALAQAPGPSTQEEECPPSRPSVTAARGSVLSRRSSGGTRGLPRPKRRLAVERIRCEANPRGGWYHPLPAAHAAQQLKARREAALISAGEPDIFKSDAKAPRQARTSGFLSNGGLVQAQGSTCHSPRNRRDRRSRAWIWEVSRLQCPRCITSRMRIPGDILKQAYEAFTEICTTLDHPMAVRGRRSWVSSSSWGGRTM